MPGRMLLEGEWDLERAVATQAARAGFMQEQTILMLKPKPAPPTNCEPIFVFRKPVAPPAVATLAGATPAVHSRSSCQLVEPPGPAGSARGFDQIGDW